MDASKLVRRPTPDASRKEFKESEVKVLSLVNDLGKEHQSGWISYRAQLIDSPEVEIISGGLSERSPDGAATAGILTPSQNTAAFPATNCRVLPEPRPSGQRRPPISLAHC